MSANRRWMSLPLALAVGLAVFGGGHFANNKSAIAAPPENDADALAHAKALSRAFRNAADATLPTVVQITTRSRPKQARRSRDGENPLKGSPFEMFEGTPFERFFEFDEDGEMTPRGQGPRSGLGSGVIIDPSGVILTNNHVVAGADEVTIKLNDGREFAGTDIKTDPRTDLAVLRITGASSLPAAKLGNSDSLEIGDWVIAIGNPFGLESTVSSGIISAKGRQVEEGQRTSFLQTDAAINPGNSGGPLINLDGEVIGINSAIATNNGSFQGVGFAIPVNTAKWVSDQLVQRGAVQRAYLGISIGPVTAERVQQFGLSDAQREGVFVGEVFPDTPASAAGLVPGDVVLKFAGQRVRNPAELQSLVERTPFDQTQPMLIVRDGREQTVQVTVKSLPEEFGVANNNRLPSGPRKSTEPGRYSDEKLGLEVAEMSPQVAKQAGYEGYRGVLVIAIDDQGPSADSRLRRGALIMNVGRNRTAVGSLDEYQAAIEKESLEKGVLLLVRFPGGGQDFVTIKSG